MQNRFKWDIERARKEGLYVSLGRRMGTGPLLRVSGEREIGDVVSDPVTLIKFAEIEIIGERAAPSTFILTSTLIDHPQMFLGFSISGLPLFLGIKRACEGHILFLGPTRTGKTTGMAKVMKQVARLGYAEAACGCKDFDPMLAASGKSGAEALTRFANGRIVAGKFRFVTHRPGLRTGVFNYLTQQGSEIPVVLRVRNFLEATRRSGQNTEASSYFDGSAQVMLQSVEWGGSFTELKRNIEKLKLNRDGLYSTAAARNAIELQAALQVDLPDGHPALVNLVELIAQRSVIYFDACYQDNGALATANAGLFVNAVIFAKRKVCPNRDDIMFLFIDEAHQFPRAFLMQIVEQCASSGIRLVMSFHTLGQMEEHWETLSMVQCKIIYGAVPGSKTEEHLQRLFGIKKEYQMNFGHSDGVSRSSGTTYTSGPSGSSVAVSNTVGDSQQFNFGLTEKEVFAWNANDTLDLNYNRNRFVIQVNPGAELSHWGPSAILAEHCGSHITFDEVHDLTNKMLNDHLHTIDPRAPKLPAPPAPLMSEELKAKRKRWMGILASTAARIQEYLN